MERTLERDPVGTVLEGYRTPAGIEVARATVPLGVVGLVDPDLETIADTLIAGNTVVVAGFDCSDVRRALADAGLPEDAAVETGAPPETEIDALVRDDETLIAERVGTHSSIFVDADATPHLVTYVAVNAAAHECVDTIILHEEFDDDAARDLEEALSYMGKSLEIVVARSIVEAVDVIDVISSGRIEAVLSSNVDVIREYASRVDACALAVNVSPAYAEDLALERDVIGLTRTRYVIEGDGQTKPLPATRPDDE